MHAFRPMHFIPLLLSCLVAACATPYPGPSTDRTATVHIRAGGMARHTALADDVVMMTLFESGQSKRLGFKRLTIEAPSTDLDLDEGKNYRIELSSIESVFGGYNSCVATVEISPLQADIYQLSYFTSHSSCRVSNRIMSGGQGEYVALKEVAGVMGGLRYHVTVNTVPASK